MKTPSYGLKVLILTVYVSELSVLPLKYDCIQWRSRTFGRSGRWSNLPPFHLRFWKLQTREPV